MKVKIQDKELELNAPVTVYDAAREAELITRAVIGAEIGGKTVALTQELCDGDEVKLLTFADAAGKHLFRHTASHILAQAVKRLYPAAKLTIGPAVENGFYYDIDSDVSFTAEALKAIEGDLENARLYYNGQVKTFNTAIELFPANIVVKGMGEDYKKRPYFEVENAEERANVKVEF